MVLSTKPAVPELLETEVGESVNTRTAALSTFKELGPPDLVHLSKTHNKTSKVDGTYHYVTGVDTSSSSAVAAYFNALTFTLGEGQIWFGKPATWKIQWVPFVTHFRGWTSGFLSRSLVVSRPTWSTTVAISTLPQTRCGQRRICQPCCALAFADDESYNFISYWTTNLLEAPPSQTVRFFDVFETLFFRGPDLGCVSEVQTPTLVNNYLVDGLIKFVKITGMYELRRAGA